MSIDRLTRVNELLRREIAEALFHLLPETDIDLSTVTVTEVRATRNLREARVLVSVRGDEALQGDVMRLLRGHRADIQRWINRRLTLKYTPRLRFQLDMSLERGDHMLQVLSEIDVPDDDGEAT